MLSHKLRRYRAAAATATDADFKQTVLLLHGDGTNGGQNNTFIDGSTNNFTITRNGNATQGTFTPFSVGASEWSYHFDGASRFQFSGNAPMNITGSVFTIEAWVYLTNTGTSRQIITQDNGSGSGTCFQFKVNTNDKLAFVYWTAQSRATAVTNTSTNAIPINQWVHVAVSYTGSTLYLFINGVQEFSASVASMYDRFADIGDYYPTAIGAYYLRTTERFTGYISNLRVLKGTAQYTSGFTPSTTPLTAITNTSLLTCQSNYYKDNSSNNYLLTAIATSGLGSVRVQPFSPFDPTSAYSTSVNGGSGYFDGTGDYLNISDSATIRFGTSNFTIQAWIYRDAAGAVHSIAAKGGASTGWVFQVHSDNKLRFTHTTTNIDSTATIPAKQWAYVAVVREGTGTNQVKIYINGVQSGQGTVSTDFTQTEQLNIGADRGNANPMNGYISGLKYNVGTAETITFPTAPPTGGTALLNFTNAAIIDNTGKNVLETVADAQIDTGTKKFGTGSLDFDGTGDWLLAPNTVDHQLGTGNFTIELWVYLATGDIGSNRGLISKGTSTTGWSVSLDATEKVVFSDTSSTITSSGAITSNTWNHIAVVREGTGSNQTKIYINGTNDGTGTVSTDFNQTDLLYVGANRVGGDPMKGFIDDVRVTKGVARYTATFTPTTAAFPDNS